MAFLFGALLPGDAQIPRLAGKPTPGDAMLADYFRNETAALSQHCLADINTLDEWKAKRGEYRRQLQEMLGLWPMPERTDLKPVVTGCITNDEFVVEKIYFQASPGLYCTANLYLPKNLNRPAPAILYECGHWSRKDQRHQLRQQGNLPAGRRVVRAQRLCLPGARHVAGRRDSGHPHRHARPRPVVVEFARLHARGRRSVVRHPRPGLSLHPAGGGHQPVRHHGPFRRRRVQLDGHRAG